MKKELFGVWTYAPLGLVVLCWVANSVGMREWRIGILALLVLAWLLCRVIWVYARQMHAAYRRLREERILKQNRTDESTDYLERGYDTTGNPSSKRDPVIVPKQHTIYEYGGNETQDLDDVGETLAVHRCPRMIWLVVLVISALLMMVSAMGMGSFLGTYRVVEGYSLVLLVLLFGAAAFFAVARLHGTRVEVCENALVTYLTDGFVGDIIYYRGFVCVELEGDDLVFLREDGSRVWIPDRQWDDIASVLPYVQQQMEA